MGGARGSGRGGDLAPCLALSGAWLLAALLVDPVAELPLNDDWAYARSVFHFLETGELLFDNRQTAPLLSHLLWGALFCLPAGPSFTALRVSTLVAGWIGILAVYGLLRELGAGRQLAALGGALLLCNPLYLGLAHTFMTDVPFTAWTALGALLFLRGARTDDGRWIALGTLVALFATLSRQLGLALPLAFVPACALRFGLGRRWALWSVVPLVVVGLGLVAFERAVDTTQGLPSIYYTKSAVLQDSLRKIWARRDLALLGRHLVIGVTYLGLFALPFLMPLAARALPEKKGRAAAALLTGALFAGLAASGWWMPLTSNVLVDFGIGPRLLVGLAPRAPRVLWAGVTLAACAGAGLLVVLGLRALARAWCGAARAWRGPGPGGLERWQAAFLAGLLALLFAPVFPTYSLLFDRYFIPLLPPLLALLLGATPAAGREAGNGALALSGRALALSGAALALLFGFGVAATHDYLALEKARWQVGSQLLARGVPREELRGGLEFDNWWPDARPDVDRSVLGPIVRRDARYALGLSPDLGWDVRSRRPFPTWLPWTPREVLVLERFRASGPSRGLP